MPDERWETDPQKMAALMLGIPGARVRELRTTADTNDLLIDTESEPVRCPGCGGPVERAGYELQELEPSSAGGKVTRVTWRRPRWRCPSSSCATEPFCEQSAAVDAFNERVSAANRRFPLRPAQSPPSDWGDHLEQ